MPKLNNIVIAAIAAAITLIIRIFVYTDDCNLLITAATFAAILALLYFLKRAFFKTL